MDLRRDTCFWLGSLVKLDRLALNGARLIDAPLGIAAGKGSAIRALGLVEV